MRKKIEIVKIEKKVKEPEAEKEAMMEKEKIEKDVPGFERETVINYNKEEPMAIVYTVDPSVWRKCERLGLKLKRIEYAQDKESVISKEFECPKGWIKIRKPRVLSPEAREKLIERGKLLSQKSILREKSKVIA